MKKRNKLVKGLRAIALAALCFSVRGQPDIYVAETEHSNEITEKLFTTVAGTGVRLKAKPSLRTTILALMYDEEQVNGNGI